jgi:hypothetical protein
MPRDVRLVDIIHVSIDRSGADEFGEVSGGALMLGCKVLLPGQVDAAESEAHSVTFMPGSMNVDIKWDCEESKTRASGSSYFAAFDIDPAERRPTELTWGIVLDRLENKQGHYQRVGYFKISSENNQDYESLKDMMGKVEAAGGLDEHNFVHKITNSQRVTIYIIAIV